MKILGIETSCDETAAAIVEDGKKLYANVVSSSLSLHAQTGGVIPEMAAREQVKFILPVIEKALKEGINWKEGSVPDIDAIAVTNGPGLIGSLLVGVETARTLSYVWDKPLIGVNHLFGHIYANWIEQEKQIRFPALALVVSGGHTDLVLMKSHKDITVVGKTRDDAAGECFDKCARLLGYSYPGGPKISHLAEKGTSKHVNLPKPMQSSDYDFSFSGLKTAFMQVVKKEFALTSEPNQDGYHWPHIASENELSDEQKQLRNDLCAKLEETIIEVLVRKTTAAMEQYNVETLLLGGGVSANKKLRAALASHIPSHSLFIPEPKFCTDNGAMIATAAFYRNNPIPWRAITTDPQLYYVS